MVEGRRPAPHLRRYLNCAPSQPSRLWRRTNHSVRPQTTTSSPIVLLLRVMEISRRPWTACDAVATSTAVSLIADEKPHVLVKNAGTLGTAWRNTHNDFPSALVRVWEPLRGIGHPTAWAGNAIKRASAPLSGSSKLRKGPPHWWPFVLY